VITGTHQLQALCHQICEKIVSVTAATAVGTRRRQLSDADTSATASAGHR
jgi:hypothetical protein